MPSINLQLSFPGSPLVVRPISARVVSTEYQHDIAELLVSNPLLSELTPYKSGAAVKLTWKSNLPGRSGTFYGYCDRIDPPLSKTHGSMTQSFAKVRCYGVSYPMKNEGFSTYSNLTADAIALDIAQRFNLAAIIDPHSFQWATYSQTGKSYWAFLVELAQRIGYTVYIVGSTLFFIDRRTAGGYTRHPLMFDIRKSPRSMNDVLSFSPTSSSGDGVDGHKSGTYVARGISQYSKQMFSVEQSSVARYGTTTLNERLFSRTITDRSPSSVGEAQMYVDAAEANSLFTSVATAEVQGTPGIHPGSVVNISVHDASYRAYSGSWYVMEVEHLLNPNRYTSRMRIGNDTSGFMKETPQRTQMSGAIGTTIRNGIWQSNRAA